jgi:3-deoxy-D-manno-octulosonate 8-phosphate phosphatase (KDO 8-P phosphatase)
VTSATKPLGSVRNRPQIARLSVDIRERLARIRMLLLDLDGVLTDGTIYLDDNGVEAKRFCVRDGFGLLWCKRFGLKTGVISGRPSQASLLRCQDLKFDEIHLGSIKKVSIFETICEKHDLNPEETAYMGDDLLDLPLLERVGLAACPADAHPEVKQRAHFISNFTGGHGAVRELIEHWLQVTNHWEECLKVIYGLGSAG